MNDPRIHQVLDAARRMGAGDFDVELPIGEGDEIDQLALALLELSHTLDRRFAELRAVARVAERVNSALVLDQVCTQV